jgi:pimeloyl-ACP methyl ester carboxylesterase
MELPDGRELAWVELGDPSGKAVLAFHGTPGSRFQVVADEGQVRTAGVRLVSVDRPGYGHSTYHPGRTLVEWPDDVRRLADHLDLDRFGVMGLSGGGPHALVCAALMPERVSAAGVLSGVGCLGEPNSEEGMLPTNAFITKMSRHTTKPLEIAFAVMTTIQRRWPEQMLRLMAKQLPAADAGILARPEMKRMLLREAKRASATTAKAAAQDFEIFSRDWGFQLADIKVPVHLWQGDADRNVPLAHARRMAAAIPGSILHEVPGGGHLMSLDRTYEILSTLAEYL